MYFDAYRVPKKHMVYDAESLDNIYSDWNIKW